VRGGGEAGGKDQGGATDLGPTGAQETRVGAPVLRLSPWMQWPRRVRSRGRNKASAGLCEGRADREHARTVPSRACWRRRQPGVRGPRLYSRRPTRCTCARQQYYPSFSGAAGVGRGSGEVREGKGCSAEAVKGDDVRQEDQKQIEVRSSLKAMRTRNGGRTRRAITRFFRPLLPLSPPDGRLIDPNAP
jgi:hypothetical protein